MSGRPGAPASVPEPVGRGSEGDRRLMARAVALARRGWGAVSPNPLVGAVVARDGRVTGEGWHRAFGTEHAEVVALRAAGPAARGATIYLTLEPCAHAGKTPPCVEAVLASGVRRVVVATRDPNPRAGGGIERLRAAGVEVALGVGAAAACRANAAFLWRHARGLPFGALKLALSLDARIAERPGVRSAVSGPRAWREVHRLRAGHDAVLVGRRTASVDDPRLTARGEPAPRRPPIRVVLDPGLRLSPEAALVRTVDEAPTWVLASPDAPATTRRALEARGVRVLPVEAAGPHALDPEAAWAALGGEGVQSVLVEGGGRVAASLLAAGLLQRLHLIYAPRLYGPEGVPAFPGLGPPGGEGHPPGGGWRPVSRRALGRDTLLVLEHARLRELARALGGRVGAALRGRGASKHAARTSSEEA